MSKRKRFAELLGQLAERHGPTLVIEVEWATVAVLVAQVQLALRHPGNTGFPAHVARGWKDHLIALIGTHSPELAELFRMGDNPANDVALGKGGAK